jgi:hypothetical protein
MYSVYKDKLQNVPLTKWMKYLRYGTCGNEEYEIKVQITAVETYEQKNVTSGKLIKAVYDSYV